MRTPTAEEGRQASQLIAFPDGRKVVLVGTTGIFIIDPLQTVRLLPTAQEMIELESEGLNGELSMAHAAVSPKGDLILAGSQDSHHLVFDQTLQQIASIGPHSEYPHFAWFSADGEFAAFNACHMYNGASIGVRVCDLAGLDTDYYQEDGRIRILERQCRVYAAVARKDELIIGDANGYIRAFDLSGEFRWEHFIGSTISALDLSPSHSRLAVTSYAGFCCVLDLDAAGNDPFSIGAGAKRELWRWLFWKEEAKPLRW